MSAVRAAVRDVEAGPGLDGQDIYALKILFLEIAAAAVTYGTEIPLLSTPDFKNLVRDFLVYRNYVNLYPNVRAGNPSWPSANQPADGKACEVNEPGRLSLQLP